MSSANCSVKIFVDSRAGGWQSVLKKSGMSAMKRLKRRGERGGGEEGKHSIFITTPAKKYTIVKCNIDNIDNIEADNDGKVVDDT